MTHLQEQAENLIKRPIPPELKPHYVPGSLTDMLLAYYVAHGKLDEEGYDLLQTCSVEADDAADRHKSQEAKRYFHDCAEILNAILAEAP